jgi:outer membrane receptor for ferrienterochelin and colicins
VFEHLKNLVLLTAVAFQQPVPSGTLAVVVRDGAKPIAQVEVQAGGQIALTNERGEVTFTLPAGVIEMRFHRVGFSDRTQRATVVSEQTTRIDVELEAQSVLEEEIIVTATRANTRIEDEPLRVEIVDQEEVDEKAVMTPGNVAMLLNETSGLRVQVTSPSLGAANVRVQGLRGRYTQVLSDGLPLYGQTGSIGILQIPPLDLGRVEVIKGVASALYGSSALGGVINLVSRGPTERRRELLLNATSRKGSDTVFWLAEPGNQESHWGYTLLGGAHFQGRSDIDRDGWSDLPEYQRGVLRPRIFWDDGSGNSLFMTLGAMVEDRAGGSDSFTDALRTRRFDGGAVGRFVLGKRLLSVRGSAMSGQHRREFGTVVERDRQQMFFSEAAISGTSGAHTWTAGSAFQVERYGNHDVPRFDYNFTTPALFAQDEYSPATFITLSASGRLDFNNRYGAFFSPRVSALVRLPHAITARVSTGTGVFAPTPFTEETEATGLSRIQALNNVRAERARSASADLGWKSKHLELNGTLFGSVIRNPVVLRGLEIVNMDGPTRTLGTEFLARIRQGRFNIVATHTYVHSTEIDKISGLREAVPLTPKYTAGFDAMWEDPERGRIGFEVYYTGRQRLEDNLYRAESLPYWVFGLLVERRIGPFRVFLNAEDIGDVRQTRHDPLVLPQELPDGRRTVEAWGPLEGRVLNVGLRYRF